MVYLLGSWLIIFAIIKSAKIRILSSEISTQLLLSPLNNRMKKALSKREGSSH
jgi:hypothetical protein